MYLDDFVEIIGGKICNKPQISYINNVTSALNALLKGDVFILRNSDDLSEAINRGAYAIVSESFGEIVDNEVAFILVDSLQIALNRFVKYIQLTNSIEILRLGLVEFHLAKAMSRDKNIAFADNIFDLVESLHCRFIAISFDVLFFEVKSLKNTSNLLFKINYQTLFELKIEYENNIYELILPNLFVKDLNNILYFFKARHIEFRISFDENLFLPIFINTSAISVRYGQSMRFVFATKDKKLLKRYVDFALSAKWGRTLLISNESIKISSNLQCQIFKNNEDLIANFLLEKYHFFVVYGVEQWEIRLREESKEQSLF